MHFTYKAMLQILVRSFLIALIVSASSYFIASWLVGNSSFLEYCKEIEFSDPECYAYKAGEGKDVTELRGVIDLMYYSVEFTMIFVSCVIFGIWGWLKPIEKPA